MSATATRPDAAAAPAETGLNSVLPWREWFALDHRSLAVFRLGLALMIFLDWFDRWPDLRVLHSDEGLLPRDAITGLNPLSIFLFDGSVTGAAVLNGAGCVLALLLAVGWRTNLMVLLNWLMIIGVHTRLPIVMQGGDHLLRMLLFWSIFLPLGACWSVDAALSGERPRPKAVLSFASAALILQVCIVYWFAAAWKWAPEWREDATALHITVQLDYFATRWTRFMRLWPEWLLAGLTRATILLEALGPAILFLPFNVAWQRLLMIFLFIGFHMGLAITLELMTFPWVCMVAWLPLIPTALWDKIQAAYTSDDTRRLQLAYDAERPRARRVLALLRTFLILNGAQLVAARLGGSRGWVVIDRAGQAHHGRAALRLLLGLSPVFFPFARLLGPAAAHPTTSPPLALTPAREAESQEAPRWQPPGGVLAHVVLFVSFAYVVIWNVGSFNFAGNRAVLPDQAKPFGMVTALEQGWGLFAPMPGRIYGWEVVVGIKKDGTQVALDKVRPGHGGGPVVWEQPELQAATYPNGRWRKLLQNLPDINGYPYLLPCYARYQFEEWNRTHGPDDQLASVEVYWMRLATVLPGEVQGPAEKALLFTYKPAEQTTGPVWFVVVGKQGDRDIDLLRSGMPVDWRRPDQLGSVRAISPWQLWLLNLRAAGALPYFTPGFAKFQFEDHNRRYPAPTTKVSAVEVYQVQEPPGAGPKKVLLARYPE